MSQCSMAASDDEGAKTSRTNWLAGGGATIALFLAGLFIKQQTDISGLETREKDYAEAQRDLFVQMQAQIDRRIGAVDKDEADAATQREKLRDTEVVNSTIIAENKAQLAALEQE